MITKKVFTFLIKNYKRQFLRYKQDYLRNLPC